MNLIFYATIQGDHHLYALSDGWYAVVCHSWATAPITVADDAAGCMVAAPVGQGGQLPYYVSDGTLHIRTGSQMPVAIAVYFCGEHRPAQIDRPVIGSTAKTPIDEILLPESGELVVIHRPATGCHTLIVQASPDNDPRGRLLVSSNEKHGIYLQPGASITLPQSNGQLAARWLGLGSAAVNIMKIENAYDWAYAEEVQGGG